MAWTISAVDALPPRLQEFVRVIGPGPTLRLLDAFPGVRIYIPAKAGDEHPIADIIGIAALRKLCDFYSTNGVGTPILMPNAKRALTAARDAQIRAEFATESARTLALRYRLTERHITRIVANAPAKNDQQSGLFG